MPFHRPARSTNSAEPGQTARTVLSSARCTGSMRPAVRRTGADFFQPLGLHLVQADLRSNSSSWLFSSARCLRRQSSGTESTASSRAAASKSRRLRSMRQTDLPTRPASCRLCRPPSPRARLNAAPRPRCCRCRCGLHLPGHSPEPPVGSKSTSFQHLPVSIRGQAQIQVGGPSPSSIPLTVLRRVCTTCGSIRSCTRYMRLTSPGNCRGRCCGNCVTNVSPSHRFRPRRIRYHLLKNVPHHHQLKPAKMWASSMTMRVRGGGGASSSAFFASYSW